MPKKHFNKAGAVALARAVMVQAAHDAIDPDVDAETKQDAVDFLFSERSEFFFGAQDVDPEVFRFGMLKRMAAANEKSKTEKALAA
jgi:hypothetical protein